MTDTLATSTIVDRYVAAWNERDADARMTKVAAAFTDDARYCDPLADVHGHAGISSMLGALQEAHPGLTIRVTSPVDEHHDLLRFHWAAAGEDGAVAIAGVDVARTAPDGRLADVRRFFGDAPQEVSA